MVYTSAPVCMGIETCVVHG